MDANCIRAEQLTGPESVRTAPQACSRHPRQQAAPPMRSLGLELLGASLSHGLAAAVSRKAVAALVVPLTKALKSAGPEALVGATVTALAAVLQALEAQPDPALDLSACLGSLCSVVTKDKASAALRRSVGSALTAAVPAVLASGWRAAGAWKSLPPKGSTDAPRTGMFDAAPVPAPGSTTVPGAATHIVEACLAGMCAAEPGVRRVWAATYAGWLAGSVLHSLEHGAGGLQGGETPPREAQDGEGSDDDAEPDRPLDLPAALVADAHAFGLTPSAWARLWGMDAGSADRARHRDMSVRASAGSADGDAGTPGSAFAGAVSTGQSTSDKAAVSQGHRRGSDAGAGSTSGSTSRLGRLGGLFSRKKRGLDAASLLQLEAAAWVRGLAPHQALLLISFHMRAGPPPSSVSQGWATIDGKSGGPGHGAAFRGSGWGGGAVLSAAAQAAHPAAANPAAQQAMFLQALGLAATLFLRSVRMDAMQHADGTLPLVLLATLRCGLSPRPAVCIQALAGSERLGASLGAPGAGLLLAGDASAGSDVFHPPPGPCDGAPWGTSPLGEDVEWGTAGPLASLARAGCVSMVQRGLLASLGSPGSKDSPGWCMWVDTLVQHLLEAVLRGLRWGFAGDVFGLSDTCPAPSILSPVASWEQGRGGRPLGPASSAGACSGGLRRNHPAEASCVLPGTGTPAELAAMAPAMPWAEGLTPNMWLAACSALLAALPHASAAVASSSSGALLSHLLPCSCVASSLLPPGGRVCLNPAARIARVAGGAAPIPQLPFTDAAAVAPGDAPLSHVFASPIPAIASAGLSLLAWALPHHVTAVPAVLRVALSTCTGLASLVGSETFHASAAAAAAASVMSQAKQHGFVSGPGSKSGASSDNTSGTVPLPPSPDCGPFQGPAAATGGFSCPGSTGGMASGLSALQAPEASKLRQLVGAAAVVACAVGACVDAGPLAIAAPRIQEAALVCVAGALPGVLDAAVQLVTAHRGVSPAFAGGEVAAIGAALPGGVNESGVVPWTSHGTTPSGAAWATVAADAVRAEVAAACGVAGWRLWAALALAPRAWWATDDRSRTFARLLEVESRCLHEGQEPSSEDLHALSPLAAGTLRLLVGAPGKGPKPGQLRDTLATIGPSTSCSGPTDPSCLTFESLVRAPVAWRWVAVASAARAASLMLHRHGATLGQIDSTWLGPFMNALTHTTSLLTAGVALPGSASAMLADGSPGSGGKEASPHPLPAALSAHLASSWACPAIRLVGEGVRHVAGVMLAAVAALPVTALGASPAALRAHALHASITSISGGSVQPRAKSSPSPRPVMSALGLSLRVCLGVPETPVEALSLFPADAVLGLGQASVAPPGQTYWKAARLALAAAGHPLGAGASPGTASGGAWPLPDPVLGAGSSPEAGHFSPVHARLFTLDQPSGGCAFDQSWGVWTGALPPTLHCPPPHLLGSPSKLPVGLRHGVEVSAILLASTARTSLVQAGAVQACPSHARAATALHKLLPSGPLIGVGSAGEVTWDGVLSSLALPDARGVQPGVWGLTPPEWLNEHSWSQCWALHSSRLSAQSSSARLGAAALAAGTKLLSKATDQAKHALLSALLWPLKPAGARVAAATSGRFTLHPDVAVGPARTLIARLGVAAVLQVLADTTNLEHKAASPSPLPPWLPAVRGMLGAGVGHVDVAVRRASAQALGEVVRLAGHVRGMAQRLLTTVHKQLEAGSDMSSAVHSGALFALAAMLRGARAVGGRRGVHLDTACVQNVLATLFKACTEVKQPLRSWALHSWVVALQSLPPRLSSEPYVASTLSLLEAHTVASGAVGADPPPCSFIDDSACSAAGNSVCVLSQGASAAAGAVFEGGAASGHWLSSPLLGAEGGAILLASALDPLQSASPCCTAAGAAFSLVAESSSLLHKERGEALARPGLQGVLDVEAAGPDGGGACGAGQFTQMRLACSVLHCRALQWAVMALGPAAANTALQQGSSLEHATKLAGLWSGIALGDDGHLPPVSAAALGVLRAWVLMAPSLLPAGLQLLAARATAMGETGASMARIGRQSLCCSDQQLRQFPIPGTLLALVRSWGANVVPVSDSIAGGDRLPTLWRGECDGRVWWAAVQRKPPSCALEIGLATGALPFLDAMNAPSSQQGTARGSAEPAEADGGGDAAGMIASEGGAVAEAHIASGAAAALRAHGAVEGAAAAAMAASGATQDSKRHCPAARASVFLGLLCSVDGDGLTSAPARAACLSWYFSIAQGILSTAPTVLPGVNVPALVHKPRAAASTLSGFVLLGGSLRDLLQADTLAALGEGLRLVEGLESVSGCVAVQSACGGMALALVAPTHPGSGAVVAAGLAGYPDLTVEHKASACAFLTGTGTSIRIDEPASVAEVVFGGAAGQPSVPAPHTASLLQVAAMAAASVLGIGLAGSTRLTDSHQFKLTKAAAAHPAALGAADRAELMLASTQLAWACKSDDGGGVRVAPPVLQVGEHALSTGDSKLAPGSAGVDTTAEVLGVRPGCFGSLTGTSTGWANLLHLSAKRKPLPVAASSGSATREAIATADPLAEGGSPLAAVLRQGHACVVTSPTLNLAVATHSVFGSLPTCLLPTVVELCAAGALLPALALAHWSHRPGKGASQPGRAPQPQAAVTPLLEGLLQAISSLLSQGDTAGGDLGGVAEEGASAGPGLSLSDLGDLGADLQAEEAVEPPPDPATGEGLSARGEATAVPACVDRQLAMAVGSMALQWVLAAAAAEPGAPPFAWPRSSNSLRRSEPHLASMLPHLGGEGTGSWAAPAHRGALLAILSSGGLTSRRSRQKAVAALQAAGAPSTGWTPGPLGRPRASAVSLHVPASSWAARAALHLACASSPALSHHLQQLVVPHLSVVNSPRCSVETVAVAATEALSGLKLSAEQECHDLQASLTVWAAVNRRVDLTSADAKWPSAAVGLAAGPAALMDAIQWPVEDIALILASGLATFPSSSTSTLDLALLAAVAGGLHLSPGKEEQPPLTALALIGGVQRASHGIRSDLQVLAKCRCIGALGDACKGAWADDGLCKSLLGHTLSSLKAADNHDVRLLHAHALLVKQIVQGQSAQRSSPLCMGALRVAATLAHAACGCASDPSSRPTCLSLLHCLVSVVGSIKVAPDSAGTAKAEIESAAAILHACCDFAASPAGTLTEEGQSQCCRALLSLPAEAQRQGSALLAMGALLALHKHDIGQAAGTPLRRLVRGSTLRPSPATGLLAIGAVEACPALALEMFPLVGACVLCGLSVEAFAAFMQGPLLSALTTGEDTLHFAQALPHLLQPHCAALRTGTHAACLNKVSLLLASVDKQAFRAAFASLSASDAAALEASVRAAASQGAGRRSPSQPAQKMSAATGAAEGRSSTADEQASEGWSETVAPRQRRARRKMGLAGSLQKA